MAGGSIKQELIAEVALELAGLPRAQRGAAVRRAAGKFGVSPSQLYALLRAYSRTHQEGTQRAQRKVTRAEAEEIHRILLKTVNKRGQVQMPVLDAVDIAQREGLIRSDLDVSSATVHRALRDHCLNRRAIEASDPAIERRSRHPNHVHVIDFSPELQWYLKPDGRIGVLKPFMVPRKPDVKAGKPHLWRYLMVDHTTGAFFVQYYYSPGENAGDLIDFLYKGWAPKDIAGYPFHGVPFEVWADQGPGFRAQVTKNLVKALDITNLELHEAGNAKASGAVEVHHSIWQKRFGSRLALDPATSLDDLNAKALETCARVNALTPHTRHGMTRTAAWLKIQPGQLRIPPDEEQFRRMAFRDPIERTVDNRLRISWAKTTYQLTGTVLPGEKVEVVEHPYADGEVRVWSERGDELDVTALERDEWGFHLGKRTATAGTGEYTRHADTATQRLQRQAEAEPRDYTQVWEEALPAEFATFVPRHGVPAVSEAKLPPPPKRTAEDVREAAFRRLGRISLEEGDWLDDQVGTGIPDDQVDELLQRLAATFRESEDRVRTA